ncbi:MAG: DUF3793 family protein [Oscillospiraceae bacterium]|nr:DUF3793 family protein [Oscillospiraceae bacterium]
MSYAECIRFEQKIAFHMAPSLLGIKCANLISLNQTEFNIPEHLEYFNKKLSTKGLVLKILCTHHNKTLVLLYNKILLEHQLHKQKNFEILEKYGYQKSATLEERLHLLSTRIESSEQFPHEIGVFLGYPADDILGFIKNKGENYMFCGYWKVYHNPEHAKKVFLNYDKCRNFLCNKLNQGYHIYQALKIS